jgi:glycerophosphoryl diester phosphodiesterase
LSVTKITADGGYVDQYPPDTVPAFLAAVDRGVERIEVDVQWSADGRIIVHHAYNLGITNDGTGIVFDHDSRYLRSLDAGSWYSAEHAGARIPFLEEVFEAVGTSVEYELDLRVGKLSFLQAVLQLVEIFGLGEITEFTSQHHFLLSHLRDLRPDALLGIFEAPYPDWMDQRLGHELTKWRLQLLGGATVAHCDLSILTDEFVTDLHQAGIRVHGAQCNSTEELARAYELELDQISTVQIDAAIAARSSLTRGSP